MSQVIVYNTGGVQELHRVSLKHAIRMLHRRVARVLDVVDGQTFGPYAMPRSVELVRYVFTHWAYKRTGRVEYSKANVLRRDRHRCAYCDRGATTIDHILPKAHGGRSTWLNTVAACGDCNWSKSDRTPAQAGMKLRITPFVPTAEDLFPASARTTKRLRAIAPQESEPARRGPAPVASRLGQPSCWLGIVPSALRCEPACSRSPLV